MPGPIPVFAQASPVGIRRFIDSNDGRGATFAISGVTRDSAGNALGGCTVKLYLASTDALIDSQVSDANGNYAFLTANPSDLYYVVAYLAGSPDVAGTTRNTLTGTGV